MLISYDNPPTVIDMAPYRTLACRSFGMCQRRHGEWLFDQKLDFIYFILLIQYAKQSLVVMFRRLSVRDRLDSSAMGMLICSFLLRMRGTYPERYLPRYILRQRGLPALIFR